MMKLNEIVKMMEDSIYKSIESKDYKALIGRPDLVIRQAHEMLVRSDEAIALQKRFCCKAEVSWAINATVPTIEFSLTDAPGSATWDLNLPYRTRGVNVALLKLGRKRYQPYGLVCNSVSFVQEGESYGSALCDCEQIDLETLYTRVYRLLLRWMKPCVEDAAILVHAMEDFGTNAVRDIITAALHVCGNGGCYSVQESDSKNSLLQEKLRKDILSADEFINQQLALDRK